MNSTLNKIKELRALATQGEWEVCEADPDNGFYINAKGNIKTVVHPYSDSWQDFCGPIQNKDDADYIVAMHSHIPQLIQEHESLLRFVETIRDEIDRKHFGLEHTAVENCLYHLNALDKELKG